MDNTPSPSKGVVMEKNEEARKIFELEGKYEAIRELFVEYFLKEQSGTGRIDKLIINDYERITGREFIDELDLYRD